MATKILITPKNSIWGVIVNPQSSNTYRHILSFDNTSLKEAFINKELFNGGDYKSLLASQPEISFTRMSSTTGTFIIEPSQYPDETFLSLLNKDFCIIEEDGVEQFYTLSGRRDRDGGNTIVFTAELDIFFTDDITTMFNDKDVNINRAMTDRFVKDQAGNIVPIYEDHTKLLKTPFFNTDPADASISTELLIPSDHGVNISPEINNFINPSSNKDLVNKILNNLNWYVFYTSLEKELNIKWASSTPIPSAGTNASPIWIGRKGLSSPTDNENEVILAGKNISWYAAVITSTGIVEIAEKSVIKKYKLEVLINGKTFPVSQAEDAALQDAATFKGSLAPLPHHPFTNLAGMDRSFLEFSLDETANPAILTLEFKPPYLASANTQNLPLGCITGPTASSGIQPLHFTLASANYAFLQESSIDYPIFPTRIFNPDPSAKFNQENEIRLNLSPYSKIKIGSSTKNKMLLAPQYFNSTNNQQIKFKTAYGYMLEAYSTVTEILDYENIYIKANPRDNTNIFEDIANYSLPTVTDAFNEYISRNKATLNTNMLKSIGSGVLGVGAAAAGGTFGAVAGIGAIAKSVGDIASQAAMIKDLKASPDKLNATGSTLLLDMKSKQITPYFQRLILYPQLTKLLAQHFYKLGYSYKDELININTVLKSRYWFNFIQADETFENIILQASAEIKQLINDTVNSGLTIWHVRDLSTFNGIKNYENENVEMSLLSAQADEGNLEW